MSCVDFNWNDYSVCQHFSSHFNHNPIVIFVQHTFINVNKHRNAVFNQIRRYYSEDLIRQCFGILVIAFNHSIAVPEIHFHTFCFGNILTGTCIIQEKLFPFIELFYSCKVFSMCWYSEFSWNNNNILKLRL